MKTILVAVDFSDTCANALKYAENFSKDIDVDRIILLKSVYISLYAQLLPTADFVQLSSSDIVQTRQHTLSQLTAISEKLLTKCHPDLKIESIISELPLLRAIHKLVEDEQPSLLIVGSNEDAGQENYDIGEQLIAIAKTSPIPVLVVPAGVSYKRATKAVVPCDFSAISRLDRLKSMPGKKKWFNPELLVLNVSAQQKHKTLSDADTNVLKELLADHDYKIYQSENKNTVQGILAFADEHSVPLIIALRGKYSFFYNLTHENITEALAQNQRHPVLILK